MWSRASSLLVIMQIGCSYVSSGACYQELRVCIDHLRIILESSLTCCSCLAKRKAPGGAQGTSLAREAFPRTSCTSLSMCRTQTLGDIELYSWRRLAREPMQGDLLSSVTYLFGWEGLPKTSWSECAFNANSINFWIRQCQYRPFLDIEINVLDSGTEG